MKKFYFLFRFVNIATVMFFFYQRPHLFSQDEYPFLSEYPPFECENGEGIPDDEEIFLDQSELPPFEESGDFLPNPYSFDPNTNFDNEGVVYENADAFFPMSPDGDFEDIEPYDECISLENRNVTLFETERKGNLAQHPLSEQGRATSYSLETGQERNQIIRTGEEEAPLSSLGRVAENVFFAHPTDQGSAEPSTPSQVESQQATQTQSTQTTGQRSKERSAREMGQKGGVNQSNATILQPGRPSSLAPAATPALKEILINFNNVSMIEYIRFISRISNKNFVFDEEDLQFNVTIVSEEATTIENLMAALLQELKIRDLSLLEQGNNLLIHRNPKVRAPARIIIDGTEAINDRETEIVTRVFRLNTLDPIKLGEIIRPLLSDDSLIEVLRDSNNLIVTDLVTNINKIGQLIRNLDSPNSGVTIGQYVVRNGFVDSLVDLTIKILEPIAQGNPFVLVPHTVTNSIYIVSNSFIVEKALAILQNLDLNEGQTKILSLESLHPTTTPVETEKVRRVAASPEEQPVGSNGGINRGINGRPLEGEGRASAIFGGENREPLSGSIGSSPRWSQDLPVGHIERTLFLIHKLRYRKGDAIEVALRKIAASLQMMETANIDLVSAINSSQWIEESNAIVFTGTATALEKVKELIEEIDVPLRQVFIEMLILNTNIDDSLTYGVDWIDRFGGGNVTGEEGFIGSSGLAAVAETLPGALPIASGFLGPGLGFNAAVIGTHLTHNGTRYNTIGGLVRAIHSDAKTDIIMNPKIITEDNNPAEIFVGGTDRYKTQSITNELGTLVTNNFQFIDVGTLLRVTPLIGNNGIITLDILQETTNGDASANATSPNQLVVDVNLVPVLTKTRTVTKVHVPDGFFVVMSGMLQDTEIRSVTRIPCLGGIPILGAVGKSQTTSDTKRNLMIFIRPLILNNEEEIEDVTRRQQDVYREKKKFRRSWNYELDEALNFGNIKSTDPDDQCDVYR